jgi:hypothetical protein
MLRGKWGLACLAVLAFAVGGQLLGNPVSQTRYAVVPIKIDSLTSIVALKHVAVSGNSQIRAIDHQNSLGGDF